MPRSWGKAVLSKGLAPLCHDHVTLHKFADLRRVHLTTILLSLLPAQRATLCRFGGAALADLQCQARFEVFDLGGVGQGSM